jgi:hypothetical protein
MNEGSERQTACACEDRVTSLWSCAARSMQMRQERPASNRGFAWHAKLNRQPARAFVRDSCVTRRAQNAAR